ncbi:hypothetical protein T01_12377 [Trichinella spiralis]|uniref:Uncharacterized protein n=1 Tax=Trichinella spiralis TaxID=6334 RepID=A0A0V1AVQ5_TRISP|nr:hypothetical protein T01_12377 [Trichinella spiralis]
MAGGGGESEVGFTARSATSVCGAASPLSLSRPLGRIIFQSAPLGFELLVLLIPGRGAAGHAGRVAVAGLLPALPSVDSIAVVAVLENNFRSFGRRAPSTAVRRGSVVVVVVVVGVIVVVVVVVAVVVVALLLGRTFQSRMLTPQRSDVRRIVEKIFRVRVKAATHQSVGGAGRRADEGVAFQHPDAGGASENGGENWRVLRIGQIGERRIEW